MLNCRKKLTQWIEDLKVTKKYVEENSHKLLDIGLSGVFWQFYYKGKRKKAKIIKWDYIKLKSFCTAKEQKGNQPNGKNMFANCIL